MFLLFFANKSECVASNISNICIKWVVTEVWRGITFSQYSRNSFWGSIFLFYFQFLLLFIWFIFDIKKIIKYKKEFFKGGGLQEKLQLRWAYSSSRRGGGELLLKRGGGNFRGSRNLYRNYEVNVCWDIQHINLAL